jgi:hypothetical protein
MGEAWVGRFTAEKFWSSAYGLIPRCGVLSRRILSGGLQGFIGCGLLVWAVGDDSSPDQSLLVTVEAFAIFVADTPDPRCA